MEREQIIKALEHCTSGGNCSDCLMNDKYPRYSKTGCMSKQMYDALALIKSQEQRIKELAEERKDFEIRALRAENEATKYKDRWETLRKDFKCLADRNEQGNKEYERLDSEYRTLNSKYIKLTEENERLRDNLDRTEKALITMDKAHNDLFTDTFRIEAEAKADTVQKYREKLYRELAYLGAKDKFNKEFFLTTADQIAKEMLEGEK